jgi:hypothetical protein
MCVKKYERGLIKGIIQRKHSLSEIHEVVYNKLTIIGGKACNNIPKAVKGALATILTKKIICFGNW